MEDTFETDCIELARRIKIGRNRGKSWNRFRVSASRLAQQMTVEYNLDDRQNLIALAPIATKHDVFGVLTQYC